ncbi:MAG: transcription termination/antitermination protein NusG [Thermoleophilia bacterium]|jgi:transcriptional antiterminator NusG|nr:transcription termination/antitermination protein NusG [Actinomycetota bacterium]
MFRWYAIHTYSGHEDKVRRNLEQRRRTQQGGDDIRRIVVPTEQIVETRDGKKVEKESRVLPGYVLVQMDATPECVSLVRNTPGVTGFVGAQGKREEMTLVPLGQAEVDKLLKVEAAEAKPKAVAEFTLGQMVKVISGPLADFDGEIIEINNESSKLKVHVSIFERQVPVELGFGDVKRLD